MPDCMKNLRTTGMEEAVRDAIRNKPFFAVCVGEQMLFEHSEEGDTPGLGIFPGDVVRFASDRVDQTGARLKVPQMGWNQVTRPANIPCGTVSPTVLGFILFTAITPNRQKQT